MAPERKAMARPAPSDCEAAWAVRTLARTETSMPMKPAAPERIAPISEAEGGGRRKQQPGDDEDDDADDGDRRVLARQVGGGAFADGAGDLLHAGIAGIGGEHRLDGPDGIDDATARRRR